MQGQQAIVGAGCHTERQSSTAVNGQHASCCIKYGRQHCDMAPHTRKGLDKWQESGSGDRALAPGCWRACGRACPAATRLTRWRSKCWIIMMQHKRKTACSPPSSSLYTAAATAGAVSWFLGRRRTKFKGSVNIVFSRTAHLRELEGGEGCAELLTLGQVADRHVVGTHGHAYRLPGDHDARHREHLCRTRSTSSVVVLPTGMWKTPSRSATRRASRALLVSWKELTLARRAESGTNTSCMWMSAFCTHLQRSEEHHL